MRVEIKNKKIYGCLITWIVTLRAQLALADVIDPIIIDEPSDFLQEHLDLAIGCGVFLVLLVLGTLGLMHKLFAKKPANATSVTAQAPTPSHASCAK